PELNAWHVPADTLRHVDLRRRGVQPQDAARGRGAGQGQAEEAMAAAKVQHVALGRKMSGDPLQGSQQMARAHEEANAEALAIVESKRVADGDARSAGAHWIIHAGRVFVVYRPISEARKVAAGVRACGR